MTARELLARVQQLGGRLSAEAGQLRYRLPKGALTAELRGALADHKTELLALLATQGRDAPAAAPHVASLAQRRLWFLHRLAPDSAAYHIAGGIDITGALDVPALERSLAALVERHDALCTTFADVMGEPVPVLAAAGQIILERIDAVADATSNDADPALAALIEHCARRPFDLTRGPLLRLVLVRRGATRHVLLLAIHHIIADAWSLGILVDELFAGYEAEAAQPARARAEAPRSPVTVPYLELAAGQAQRIAAGAVDTVVAAAARSLRDAPALALPTDHPRSREPRFAGATERAWVAPALVARLGALAARHGATLFVTLLAAWNALLARLADQTDIVVGIPVAGRDDPRVDRVIGPFVDTHVLRTQVRLQAPFAGLIDRVRDAVLARLAAGELPFEKLVEAVAPAREPGRSPLFDVMFVLQNAPLAPRTAAGLQLSPFAIDTGAAKLDLTLFVEDAAGGALQLRLEYRTDLFEADTARRTLGYYTRLLDAVAADPERPVADIDLLDDAERHQVVVAWNPTQLPDPDPACLHELIEAQVDRTPARCAVVLAGPADQPPAADAALSYRALDQRANGVAARLRALGVGPDAHVAVSLERSLDLVVALLGVLKAGAAYVPLDPHDPPARLAYILDSARAGVVLTSRALAPRWPAGPATVLAVDPLPPHPDRVAPAARPADLAYVIYTSGSTGRPKGVMVPHAGIVNRLRWMQHRYPLAPHDRVLHKTPYGFDVSLWELFWPLLAGAQLVVAPPGEHRDPAALALRLARDAISTVHFVPSMLRAFLDHAPALPLPALRRIFASGEALSVDLRDRCFASPALGRAELHNLYGPTEASVDVTAWHCSPLDPAVPIGRPIANTQIFLLDSRGRPVPRGAVGELCIGGIALARGYAGRPDLTAERFVPDAVSGAHGARLYRTGDRARFGPHGRIEYLGRADDQVKLRGHRIELGEIEAVLAELPGVRAAAAALRDDGSGPRLVGYVVADPSGPSDDALLAALASRLPAALVPHAIVHLPDLPRLTSGKLDRRALPAPATARPDRAGAFVPPRSPAEQLLAAIFADVLRLDRVGVHDDFFRLGGHSLLATRVAARVRDALGAELPLRTLVEAPSVAALAVRIDGLRRDPGPAVPPPCAVPRDRPLPLSFAQRRLWFLARLQPGAAYHITGAYRLDGRVDAACLQRSLAALVRRHEPLRTTFATLAGRPVQRIHDTLDVALEVIDEAEIEVTGAGDRDVAIHARLRDEARRPFDLEHGPLLRATLVRRGGASPHDVLVLSVHHIVFDGASLGVFLRELAEAYDAEQRGAAPAWPPLAIHYADVAVWQHATLTEDVIAGELDYWRARLAGAAPLDLPLDRRRPALPSDRGGLVSLAVPRATQTGVAALARSAGVTPFMVLLTACKVLLRRHASHEDIVVGTPVAGRGRRELEGLIGCFVNTLVLRTEVPAGATLRALLARVRDTVLGAADHDRLPFERLVEALALERDVSRTPLFQVAFVHHPPEPRGLVLDGVRAAPVAWTSDTAKFDLTVIADESAGDLVLRAEYRSDLFDGATATRMLAQLGTILDALATAPDTRVGDVALASPAEQRALLAVAPAAGPEPLGSDTLATDSLAGHASLHDAFAAQVARDPGAPAVSFAGATISYGELDRRAARLARALTAAGVGPEVVVGIFVEPSLERVVGLLGIVRAGAAYLPLEPDAPDARAGFMVRDAGVAVIVTQRALAGRLPAQVERVVFVDDDALSDAAPAERAHASRDQLAYVIYTSGSTGEPKGVQVTHGNVLRLLSTTAPWFGFGPGDTWTHAHAYAFDFSVWEIWGALVTGGRVVIVPREVSRTPVALRALLAAERVTVLNQTPSAFRPLVRADAAATTPLALRLVILGGEALDLDALRPWFERHGDEHPRVVNMYGITETTVHVTYRRVRQRDLDAAPGSVIGGPIPDLVVRLLDDRLRPVPVGVPGEICVGGAGLARGYLGRPALTAARFVPDPFSETPGARLYRSGDLARRLPDGDLQFLGRADEQIKLRGFRIEPGEITHALSLHPEVAEAAVVLREDVPGDRRLVAYVVARAGEPPGGLALRRFVAERLPEHMVPASVVVLDRLPLTANGKLDRRALPAPDRTREAGGAAYQAPASAIEAWLAEIWRRVLAVDRVGVHDNFFDLGGNSLLIADVHDAVQQRFAIAMVDLFRFPTISALSARLAQPAPAERPTEPRAPEPRGSDERRQDGRARLEALAQRRRGAGHGRSDDRGDGGEP